MQIDRYSRFVLTVIAAALSVIATRQLLGPADAQGPSCGEIRAPCAVVNVVRDQYDNWTPCFEADRRCYAVGSIR